MLMRIQISSTDSAGHTEMHPIDVEAEMPDMGIGLLMTGNKRCWLLIKRPSARRSSSI